MGKVFGSKNVFKTLLLFRWFVHLDHSELSYIYKVSTNGIINNMTKV